MARNSLLADIDLCVGCSACEVACKQEHDLPAGPKWMKVVKVGPTRVGGKLTMSFVPMHCMHCGQPECLEACPEQAISKRSDGIVLINEELCTGCQSCIEACPYGAIQYNQERNIVQKCDLCVGRIDKGLQPACVYHCPSQALYFGDPNTLAARIRERRARSMALSE